MTVQILHISDLHFGKHDAALRENLEARVRALRPDVIVCTGDLVDEPKDKLFDQAVDCLKTLAELCPQRPAPRLIVVPGNHDDRKRGYLWSDDGERYDRMLLRKVTDHWYLPENVWIWGFDSARDGNVGGGGVINDEELQSFHQKYELLNADKRFKDAFKIVAVHHHPLPVNWDTDWKQRWLTMTNAGAFLSAMLVRRIDVVLHGHEHLKAHARLRSTLGGSDATELAVFSLGATLRKMENREQNWFSVLEVTSDVQRVTFYPSIGKVFSEEGEEVQIRSTQAIETAAFERWEKECGHSYRELASIAVLTKDGDARRFVDCEGLRVLRNDAPRAAGHKVQIPPTSGYLDCLSVDSPDMGGLSIDQIPRDHRPRTFTTNIKFGRRRVQPGEPVSYSYNWYAVNSFAMDSSQFEYQYTEEQARGRQNIEFTHFAVSDPIEELTVVAKFPEGFRVKDPQVRVTTMENGLANGGNDTQIEARLKRRHALRYYRSLNIAALRVARPVQGLSYGIQWGVEERGKAKATAGARQAELRIQELRRIWTDGSRTEIQRKETLEVLGRLAEIARELMPEWSHPIEVSFMYFLPNERRLLVLAAILESDHIQEQSYQDFSLGYGYGIAGRAFKANEFRVYAHQEEKKGQEREPDYYFPVPGGPRHQVLLAIPIQSPSSPETPYGVLSFGSDRVDCPLAQAGLSDGPAPNDKLLAFQQVVNEQLLKDFSKIYLD